MHNDSAELLPFVPDLRKDKFHVWISRWHWVPMTVLGGILVSRRRMGVPPVGHLFPNCCWASLDVASELSHAHVGITPLSHR
jgi:hypothetical protein